MEASLSCKVRPAEGALFLGAETSNLSRTGALLEVVSRRPLRVGEAVEVGIGFGRGAVLSGGSLVPGRVVRSMVALEGRQRIAVAFDRPVDEVAGLMSRSRAA